MNTKKIFLLGLMLILSSLAVSAASNDYIVSSRGQGFDARSLSTRAEHNSIFADFFTDTQQTNFNQNNRYQNNYLNGIYTQNNHQGTQGYQRNLVESYGTCEPGEQTYNSKTVVRQAFYPVQNKARYGQQRGLEVTKIRTSGCNGYRFNLQESNDFRDTFDIKDMRLTAQQTQEDNSLAYQASRDFNRRYLDAAQTSTKTTVEQDRFIPFRGNRAILNPYYPYAY